MSFGYEKKEWTATIIVDQEDDQEDRDPAAA